MLLVIAFPRCWGPVLIATTIVISISILLNEITGIAFVNGMCASRRCLRKSQAGMFRCQFRDQLLPVGTQNAVFVDVLIQ